MTTNYNQPPTEYYPERIQAYAAQADAMTKHQVKLMMRKLQVVYTYVVVLAMHLNNYGKY